MKYRIMRTCDLGLYIVSSFGLLTVPIGKLPETGDKYRIMGNRSKYHGLLEHWLHAAR